MSIFYLLLTPYALTNKALVGLRIVLGIMTVLHGLPKIFGGKPKWKFLGSTMQNLGIYFAPVMWGFIAASTEFFGGILLVLGLGTRIVSLLLVFMMFVAMIFHLKRKDLFNVYSYSLALFIIFVWFFIVGSGRFSLDYYFFSMLF